ncbi:Gfo/Idh/MocA family protein [Actinophytocola algeriensis]|uniref:Putative dehydrogenase n=1 Tax=Actinophytocola algeriensis TaxID=1768010 RepID=A0A7W7Q5L1_9PSEU|nr:Gfo/Idh/MocA family oxidoreductase [Actinophytocola algeriensis]MBB4907151.1 putative dehydrogenase [Actinophytocola algeriensis]MBE1478634.1 putative dehydrogenase [Actinophytocola algeriensis]
MSEDVLRMGLVGAGQWAHKVHGPGIAAHPRTELVATWARRPEAAAEVAALGKATPFADFDEFLQHVDAVAFAVPPAVQAPLATRAAQAGKHLVLEKPVAPSADEAARLAQAVADAGVTSIMMLTFRYDPATREWLDEVHRTGEWDGGLARWFSGTLLDTKYENSQWRHDGGALADIGPHVFDLLDAALGPVVSVEQVRFDRQVWHVLLGHETGRLSAATLSMHTPVFPAVTDFAVHGPHGFLAFDASGDATSRYAVLLDDFVRLVGGKTAEHPLDVRRGLHLQRLLGRVTDQLAGG